MPLKKYMSKNLSDNEGVDRILRVYLEGRILSLTGFLLQVQGFISIIATNPPIDFAIF